jgi:hypothetical protein
VVGNWMESGVFYGRKRDGNRSEIRQIRNSHDKQRDHDKLTMKTKLAVILCFAFIVALYASLNLPPYDKSKSPSMSLPEAYGRAVAALGPETNQFHCISANITTTFSRDGEWYFTFYSANPTPKYVVVEFSGKVIFDNGFR